MLSPEEQAKLKDFLAELYGTNDAFQEKTIVLLSPRSAEQWLALLLYPVNSTKIIEPANVLSNIVSTVRKDGGSCLHLLKSNEFYSDKA